MPFPFPELHNVADEVAETEIITVKMAETEEVVKSVENFRDFLGVPTPKNLKTTHPKKFKNMVLNGLNCLLAMHFILPLKPKSCPCYNVLYDSMRFLCAYLAFPGMEKIVS